MQTSSESASATPPRSWRRFSLRSLLGLLVVVAVPLAWKVNQLSTERRVVAEIEAAGGQIARSDPWAPEWCCAFLGREYFSYIDRVSFYEFEDPLDFPSVSHGPFGDEHLAMVARLPYVRSLKILSNHVSSAGFRRLAEATTIAELEVHGPFPAFGSDGQPSSINSQGIAHLARLPRLEKLTISIRPSCWSDLAKLQSVKELSVTSETVSPEWESVLELPRLEVFDLQCWTGETPPVEQIEAAVRRQSRKLKMFSLSTGKFHLSWQPRITDSPYVEVTSQVGPTP